MYEKVVYINELAVILSTLEQSIYNLYIATTNGIPKDEDGNEFEVLYCVEKGKKISSEIENNPNLKYYLIVLQKTKNDIESAKEIVRTEWEKFCDLNIVLEFITSDLKKIQKKFKELILNCESETVIFKTQIVGFDEKSIKELNGARKLILNASTKSKLNLWN